MRLGLNLATKEREASSTVRNHLHDTHSDGQNGTTQPKRSFSAEALASIRVRKRLGSEQAVIHVLAATTQGGAIKDPGEEGDEHVALANRNPFVHSPWRGVKNALYCKRNMHISTAAKMRWEVFATSRYKASQLGGRLKLSPPFDHSAFLLWTHRPTG